MCSHYQGITSAETFQRRFGLLPPAEIEADLWPGTLGAFVRARPRTPGRDSAGPATEVLPGHFGLVPHWATDPKIMLRTYNARSETVASKPSFRDAVRNHQRCIIPAQAIYEPDWRSGRAVATRIDAADGEILGIAGLWARWRSPTGGLLYSYTMLAINADAHPLMQQFHRPTDEKRMVVVLERQRYGDWLDPAMRWEDFMLPYPAQALQAHVPPPVQQSLID